MITVISPAKNMRHIHIENIEPIIYGKSRHFTSETNIILNTLKNYSPWELSSLMKINEKLSLQSYSYYQDFNFEDKGVCGLLAYDGLAFKNIKAENFSKEDFSFADEHVKILDAFYGIVNPLDGILPYRLEMLYPIKIQDNNLYSFWSDKIYKKLYSQDNVIINLASEEYAKIIRRYLCPGDTFIDIDFKVHKDGKLKTLATYAKMARGQMINYIVKNKLNNPDDLKLFTYNNFKFNENLSSSNKYVFIKED